MIDKIKINRIQSKIRSIISEIEKSENVKIEFGTARYNSAYYSTTMKVSTLEEDKKVDSVYELMCKKLGFTQNIIGMEFTKNYLQYEIVDIKLSNRKYPVIVNCISTKKLYKYPVDSIKGLLGGDKIINRNANLSKLIGK